MPLGEQDRERKMHELTEGWFGDKFADRFFWDFISAVQWHDDLVDGDTNFGRRDAKALLDLFLYEIPGNQFFLAYHRLLLPVIRKIISDWDAATEIEIEARETGNLSLLTCSFELRNSFFDLATYIVDVKFGAPKRREFASLWLPISRDCLLYTSPSPRDS